MVKRYGMTSGEGGGRRSTPRKSKVYSGGGRSEPRTIFGLLLQAVTEPGYVGDLGVGGVTGRGMLMQLQIMFGVCVLMAAFPQAVVYDGGVLKWAIVRTAWVLAFTVALAVPAMMSGSGATFLGLLSGLAVVEILLSLGLTLLFGVLWVIGDAVGDASVMEFFPWLHRLGRLAGYGAIIAGVFELGCLSSVVAAFAMNIFAWALTPIMLGILGGTGG
jgi:hypothetical protein